jgi:ketosteroid isomerase-like protein
MKKLLTVLFIMSFSLATQSQVHRDEDEIRRLRGESNQAIVEGKIAAFSASLADDFVIVRGNGVFASREAYIAAFTHDFKDPSALRYERVIDKIELSTAAPLAAEHGHWLGHTSNGHPAYGGTYLAMWRHTATGWKIRSELFILLSCSDARLCAAYTDHP